jgi:protein-tyrosine-phosphatase
VRAATEFGIDLSGHRAQQLHPGALEGVELAIGFEPAHVAAALAAGVSPDRAFLLTELAQILEFDVLPWPEGVDSLESRVAHANARRFAGGRLPSAVVDPVGGSDRMFRQTYEEIDRMVAVIGLRLFGASGARTG